MVVGAAVVVVVVGAAVVVVVVGIGAAVVVVVVGVHEVHALVTLATGLPLITDTDTNCPPKDTYQVPVPAAANIAPVKVVAVQKLGLLAVTTPEARNPQASSEAPPKPIKNDNVVVVVVVVGANVVVVVVGAAVVVVVVAVPQSFISP